MRSHPEGGCPVCLRADWIVAFGDEERPWREVTAQQKQTANEVYCGNCGFAPSKRWLIAVGALPWNAGTKVNGS